METITSRQVLYRNNEISPDQTIKQKAVKRIALFSGALVISVLVFLLLAAISVFFVYVFGTSNTSARSSEIHPLLTDSTSCVFMGINASSCFEDDLEDLLEQISDREAWSFADFFDILSFDGVSSETLTRRALRDTTILFNGTQVEASELDFKLCKALFSVKQDGEEKTYSSLDQFITKFKPPIEGADFKELTSNNQNLFQSTTNTQIIPEEFLMFTKINETRTCYVHPNRKNIIGFTERTMDYYNPGRQSLTSICGYVSLAFLISCGACFAFTVIPLTVYVARRCWYYKQDIETMQHMEMNDQESLEGGSDSESGSQVSDDGRRYF